MFDLLKRLLKHSAAYAIGTMLNRAMSIVLLPLYTRYLSKNDYGILEFLTITSSVIVLLMQLGMGSALFRSVLYKKNTDSQVLISTALYFLILCSITATALLIAFARPISHLLFHSDAWISALRILFVTDFFLIVCTIPMARLRMDEKSIQFVIIACANFLIGMVLNIIFVVVLKKGIDGIVTANLIAAVLFAALYLWAIRKDIKPVFDLSELKDMLEFGLPLVPSAIGDMVLMMSDRYFLGFYWDFEKVAVYGVAARIALVMSLLVGSFQMAWPAVLFSIAKTPEAQQIFSRLFDYFLFSLAFVALGISVFAPNILDILATEKFLPGADVVPFLVFAFIFYGIYYYTSIGLNLNKKTIFFPLLIGMAAVVNITLGFILIPSYGIIGAGWAKLIAFVVLGVSTCYFSQRHYHVPYNYRRFASTLGSVAGILFLSKFVPDKIAPLYLVEKFIILMLFPIALYIMGFFGRDRISIAYAKVLKSTFDRAIL